MLYLLDRFRYKVDPCLRVSLSALCVRVRVCVGGMGHDWMTEWFIFILFLRVHALLHTADLPSVWTSRQKKVKIDHNIPP